MRRAGVSWVNCAQETMNRAGLRCALALAVPGRLVEQSEADTAFRVGMRLMQSNKFTMSFPVFVLVADLYRTFTAFDLPVDNGFINESDLTRRLAEMEMPHRISPYAVKAIFDAVDDNEIGFPLFCFSVIVYNRWKQYSSANHDKPLMDLNTFLAVLHDRMVPG
jgi:hypothetical protein